MMKVDPALETVSAVNEGNGLGTTSPNQTAVEVESEVFESGDGFEDFSNIINKPRGKHKVIRSTKDAGRTASGVLSESLVTYKYDCDLARDENILVTVKTTLQVHKNERQEEQMKRPSAHVFGREAARQYVPGFVAAIPLKHNLLDWSLAQTEWAFSALEPYSVDIRGDRMALSGGNYVKLIALDTGHVTSIQHPWLSQCHTVQFSGDGDKLLVASSGFDAVVEFDAATQKVVWEWFAWDHGYDRSKLGHYVVRSAQRSQALQTMGQDVLLVNDPGKYEFGIPTRMSPTHLNSACYDGDGRILVTLFHQGMGILVDKENGESQEVVAGLVNPHKLARRAKGGYHISDTRRGKLVLVDDRFLVEREISLSAMPGVERCELLSEFLQNTTELKEDLFACVDIHRNTLWLLDSQRRRYRGIKFPIEWSMHDVASLKPDHDRKIRTLIGSAFGRIEASEQESKTIRHFSPQGVPTMVLALDSRGRSTNFDVKM